MTARRLAIGQGLYYLVTGVWPLVSMPTFQRVTGPKTDDWLVRTVGLLAAAIGAVLLVRGARGERSPDPLLGVATAAAFGATDTVHVLRGEISPIYLGDAVVEAGIIAAWVAVDRSGDAQ
jgi:hypothetical protein